MKMIRPVTFTSLMLFFVTLWESRKKLRHHPARLLPPVVTKLKLPRVLLEVLRRDVDVGPADRVLEPREVALDGVRMNLAPHVLLGTVLDRLVRVALASEAPVGGELVAVDGAALLHVGLDDRDQGALGEVGDDLRHHVAVSLHDAHDDGLAKRPPAGPPGAVTADVGLVHLDHARQRLLAVHGRHVLADFVPHPPSGLVRHAELALQLLGRDAVARRGEQVHGIEPVLQRGPAVFKDCTRHRVQMMTAPLARIGRLLLDAVPLRGTLTGRALVALAETGLKQVVEARLVIRELLEELADGRAHGPFPLARSYV